MLNQSSKYLISPPSPHAGIIERSHPADNLIGWTSVMGQRLQLTRGGGLIKNYTKSGSFGRGGGGGGVEADGIKPCCLILELNVYSRNTKSVKLQPSKLLERNISINALKLFCNCLRFLQVKIKYV